MIALIDYCAGNLRSVKRALDFLEIENIVTKDPQAVEQADALIIPGVGAAGAAMKNLEETGLVEAIKKSIQGGKPFLGICLGLQILFERSTEDDSKCLGMLAGEVTKIDAPKIKIPHIGWNSVDFENPSPLLEGIESGTPFYFVHSYISQPKDSELVKATTTHGTTFPALIQQGNIWATQFHPEKSGKVGLQVLSNFAKLI
jgi:imidazole glycerol-phosphate synthase subunit HisH